MIRSRDHNITVMFSLPTYTDTSCGLFLAICNIRIFFFFFQINCSLALFFAVYFPLSTYNLFWTTCKSFFPTQKLLQFISFPFFFPISAIVYLFFIYNTGFFSLLQFIFNYIQYANIFFPLTLYNFFFNIYIYSSCNLFLSTCNILAFISATIYLFLRFSLNHL